MVERNIIPTPPSRACAICRNSMGELCLSRCAPKGDYSEFRPDMDKPLDMMPKLSFEEYMELPGSMKGKWLFVIQTKILEVINGDEPRTYPYRTRGLKIPKAVKVKGVLPHPEGADPVPSDREKRENTGE